MAEGRLAPVRETDRHAGVLGGIAAAFVSAAAASVLPVLGTHSAMQENADNAALGTTATLVFVAFLGFVVGGVESYAASRQAKRAADRFAPIRGFLFGLARVMVPLNALVAAGVVFLAFDDSIALGAGLAAAVAALATIAAIALFGWSHAVDWPQVPDYLRNVPAVRQPARHESLDLDDVEAMRAEVISEPRSARNTDEVWMDLQELISGHKQTDQ